MKKGSRTAAVILAAGSSTRMGTAKQLLLIDDRPLLQHVLDNVRQSAVGEVVLVLGHAAETIKAQLELQNVQVLVNDQFHQGMGSSLRTGLAAVDSQTEAALIILADQPFVRPATLDTLMAEHARARPQIVIPTYRGFRGNPVLLDHSIFPEVMTLSGDVGCRAIFGDHLEGIVKVPVKDVGVLLDIDRQSDYQKLQRYRSGVVELPVLQASHPQGESSAGREDASGPELVIVGNDAMVTALAKLARVLQFKVTIVDPLLDARDMPEASQVLHVLDFSRLPQRRDRQVVVASRGACDEEAVEQALGMNSSYVALVANRRRGEEVLRSLKMRGLTTEKLRSVHVPAGLDIGAATPEEIALSVMAEIVAERNKPVATPGSPES